MTFVSVRLVAVPVALHMRAAGHFEEVKRELALMELDPTSEPGRLLGLATEVRERFAQFTAPANAVLESAAADGDTYVDLQYEVPMEIADAAAELGAILDEVDRYAQAGRLLVLATPADAIAYRRWFLGEFVAQASGSPLTPWNAAPLVRQEHRSRS